MQKSIFRPLNPKLSISNVLSGPTYEATLDSPLFEEGLRMKGRVRDGFTLFGERSGITFATGEYDSDRAWCLHDKLGIDSPTPTPTPTPTVATVEMNRWGRLGWGEEKRTLELENKEWSREFSDPAFKIVHRDYQNTLEIWSAGEPGVIRGAWFSFWYWHRKNAPS